MKLWKRTVLLMLTTLFLALLIVGGLTLYYTCEKNMDTTATTYKNKLDISSNMWDQIWDAPAYGLLTETGQASYLQVQFETFFGSGHALILDGEVILNSTGFRILDLTPIRNQEEGEISIQRLNGRYYLLQSTVLKLPQNYQVLGITDVTEKIMEIRNLMILYLLIYCVIFILAGAFIYWMMRRNMQEMERLQDTAKKQEELLGALAHEMKTPLTSIIGYSDSLLHVKLSKEMQEKSLLHINREGHRLESLTGKIMQLVGLYKNDTIFFQVYPIRELMERVVSLEAQKCKEAEVELILLQEEFDLNMDMDLMESMVLNLVDNALRASKEGGRITLQTTVCDGKRQIIVKDQGTGIPKEEIGKITEAFYMVDKSRSRKAGGAGLGLALCQKIVWLHGGQMEIDSTLGEGTKVTISF